MSQALVSPTPRFSARDTHSPAAAPAVDAAGSSVDQAGRPAPKGGRKRLALGLVALVALGLGAWKGNAWFTVGRFSVTTDDAYVKADTAVISAKIAGYVTAVPAMDNRLVKAGDVLARIDDGDYALAVDAAQRKITTQNATISRLGEQARAQDAMIDLARANLDAAKADIVRTAAEFDRAKNLQRSSFGTQQKLDQALADRDRSTAALEGAKAQLAAAQAAQTVMQAQQKEAESTRGELESALARTQRDMTFTEIRAPFAGTVGNRAVQIGQYVQPGTRLLALVPMDSVYVEANFKETQLQGLKPGQPVTLEVDAFSEPITGTLDSVAPSSGAQFSLLPPDNATGNFTKIVQRVPVRISVPRAAAERGNLRPGLSVEVAVDTRDPNQPPPTLLGALGLRH